MQFYYNFVVVVREGKLRLNYSMSTKLTPLEKRESVTTTLTLPVSVPLKLRYDKLKNDLNNRDLNSLHSLTRERIKALLDDVEKQLASVG